MFNTCFYISGTYPMLVMGVYDIKKNDCGFKKFLFFDLGMLV